MKVGFHSRRGIVIGDINSAVVSCVGLRINNLHFHSFPNGMKKIACDVSIPFLKTTSAAATSGLQGGLGGGGSPTSPTSPTHNVVLESMRQTVSSPLKCAKGNKMCVV